MHLNQISYRVEKNGNTSPMPKSSSGPQKSVSVSKPLIITIDGPAASGKTTVSRELARRLALSWVSTGAFYRGLAYVATQLKCDLSNEGEIIELVRSKRWSVEMTHKNTNVIFDGKDVTDLIMDEKVGAAASQISQFPGVRRELLPLQRNCVKGTKGLIAEGRDCGTVVFPDAQLKVYLTARSDNRAQRRAIQQGDETGEDLSRIKADQMARDQRDTKRTSAPLQIPKESKVLDTSDMGLDEVVSKLREWVAGVLQN